VKHGFSILRCAVKLHQKEDRLFLSEKIIHWLKLQVSIFLEQTADELSAALPVAMENVSGILQELLMQLDSSHNKDVELIEQEATESRFLLSSLTGEADWIVAREGQEDGITTCYKHVDGSSLYSVRVQGVVEEPLFNVISIFFEADLYPQWVPTMDRAYELKRLSRYRKLAQFSYKLPWPLARRDIFCYGYGVDIAEQNAILVVVRSVDGSYGDIQIPEPDPGTVRMDVKYAGFLFRAIDKSTTHVSVISCTDPKMSVPYFLQNYGLKKVAHRILLTVRKFASSVAGSEYEERMNSDKYVYDDLRRRCRYFADPLVTFEGAESE
jgi:hypothetical protein